MNNLLLTTFLLTTGLAVLLGAATGSAMAFPGDVDSYNYSETKKHDSYEESEDYEFDNMHKMFKDCFEYHHNFGEYGYKDKDKMSDYSYDNYNHTNDGDYKHGDYKHGDYKHGDYKHKDCYGMMSFMKDHMMMFDMPFMGGHDRMMFDMPFMGGHATPGTITVAGTATASVEPERVVITMGVETVRPTASAALAENSELLDMAVNSVVSLGIPIDDIATSRITIHPEYDIHYDVDGQHRQTFAGYNVRNIIMVNTDQINMTAAILDTAVQAGVNNVESVQFTVSDDTKIRIQESLIETAVLNAKHQAHLALKPLQHTIIGVEDVTVDPSSGVPLERISANLFDAFASIATPIFTPDEDLSATVLVTFLIGPDYYE